MTLLAEGCRDKELPGRLHVTSHTARTFLRRAMVKLGAKSRAEAVAIWSRVPASLRVRPRGKSTRHPGSGDRESMGKYRRVCRK